MRVKSDYVKRVHATFTQRR